MVQHLMVAAGMAGMAGSAGSGSKEGEGGGDQRS